MTPRQRRRKRAECRRRPGSRLGAGLVAGLAGPGRPAPRGCRGVARGAAGGARRPARPAPSAACRLLLPHRVLPHLRPQPHPAAPAWRTARDGAEPLLPRSVPHLQLGPPPVQQHLFDLKVDAAGESGVGGWRRARLATVPRFALCPAKTPASPRITHPMVVIKDEVNESSEKRSSRHDLPTPGGGGGGRCAAGEGAGGGMGAAVARARAGAAGCNGLEEAP